jgi:hypothetical protein
MHINGVLCDIFMCMYSMYWSYLNVLHLLSPTHLYASQSLDHFCPFRTCGACFSLWHISFNLMSSISIHCAEYEKDLILFYGWKDSVLVTVNNATMIMKMQAFLWCSYFITLNICPGVVQLDLMVVPHLGFWISSYCSS